MNPIRSVKLAVVLMCLIFSQASGAKTKPRVLNLKACQQFKAEVLAEELLLAAVFISSSGSETCRKKAPELRAIHLQKILAMEKAGPSGVTQSSKLQIKSLSDVRVQSVSALESELNAPGTAFRVDYQAQLGSGKIEKGFFTFVRNLNEDDVQNLGCGSFLLQPTIAVELKDCP